MITDSFILLLNIFEMLIFVSLKWHPQTYALFYTFGQSCLKRYRKGEQNCCQELLFLDPDIFLHVDIIFMAWIIALFVIFWHNLLLTNQQSCSFWCFISCFWSLRNKILFWKSLGYLSVFLTHFTLTIVLFSKLIKQKYITQVRHSLYTAFSKLRQSKGTS